MAGRAMFHFGLFLFSGLFFLNALGSGAAAGPLHYAPDVLNDQARSRALVLDPKARLILASYKLGNTKGLFEQGVFVYHSPGLEKAGSRWNCHMVVVGRRPHFSQIRLDPPKGKPPLKNPQKPLKMAWDWALGFWWHKQKEPYLNVTLRLAQEDENLPRTCRWVWEIHALSTKEECQVLIDAEKMRNIRAVFLNGPDPTPPPADHFK
jgi:hypothetical protein